MPRPSRPAAPSRSLSRSSSRSGSSPSDASPSAGTRPERSKTRKPATEAAPRKIGKPADRPAGKPAAKPSPLTGEATPRFKATPASASRPRKRPTTTAPAAAPSPHDSEKGTRIAKRIADSGLCSRREAERWIEEGRVTVEGKTITSPALNVLPHQPVMVNGKPLPEAETTRLWLYHKPAGQITSHSDPQGRPTVFEAVEGRIAGRVQSVGRLDFHSEGLLLLTNDGELKRFIELPATGWIRRYRVRVFGTPEAGVLAKMAAGVTIDGIRYGPMEVTLDKEASNSWLTVSLKEGKNREIRRVFEHFGFNVNRLIRTAYGPFQLAELPRGDLKEVPRKMLRASVGQKVTLRD